MRQFRTQARLLRPIAAVLLAVLLQGCMHWIEVPEPKSLAAKPHSTVRVTFYGEGFDAGKRFILKHPTVVGDSLVTSNPERTVIPFHKITYVEARTLDPIATGFFTLVGAVFLAFTALR
jgi:hypothetical protein